MVLRLALIYYLLDRWTDATKSNAIAKDHLEAALAVWRYCEQSAQQLFGGKGGDVFADKLLQLLNDGPKTRTELNKHLSPKQKEAVVDTLERMERAGQVRRRTVKQSGAGRPATQWEKVTDKVPG
jgi:hypothetical protein